eukprot:GHVS01102708.1.p1 GENE.GHVS01102708.1~~GHVS01102708.1.p1  ORF type:complete len:397 (-),score=24.14 GHVS01102708.1:17-1207(-)
MGNAVPAFGSQPLSPSSSSSAAAQGTPSQVFHQQGSNETPDRRAAGSIHIPHKYGIVPPFSASLNNQQGYSLYHEARGIHHHAGVSGTTNCPPMAGLAHTRPYHLVSSFSGPLRFTGQPYVEEQLSGVHPTSILHHRPGIGPRQPQVPGQRSDTLTSSGYNSAGLPLLAHPDGMYSGVGFLPPPPAAPTPRVPGFFDCCMSCTIPRLLDQSQSPIALSPRAIRYPRYDNQAIAACRSAASRMDPPRSIPTQQQEQRRQPPLPPPPFPPAFPHTSQLFLHLAPNLPCSWGVCRHNVLLLPIQPMTGPTRRSHGPGSHCFSRPAVSLVPPLRRKQCLGLRLLSSRTTTNHPTRWWQLPYNVLRSPYLPRHYTLAAASHRLPPMRLQPLPTLTVSRNLR